MKLLVGHDGSQCAEAAVDDLRRAGLAGEGEAIVLTAADLWPHLEFGALPPDAHLSMTGMFWGAPGPANAMAMAERAMREAKEICQKGADQLRAALPGWRVEAEAMSGTPHSALIRKADDWRPDLLVVGSHGRSLMGRIAMGSVSLQVVTHAACSVRVGRPSAERRPGPPRLMVGVDGSSPASAAVATIARRKWPAGTLVRVVGFVHPALASVVPMGGASPLGWPFGADEDLTRGMTRIAADAVAELKQAGLSAEAAVSEGNAKTELVRAAAEWQADCLYVGATGLTRLQRFLLGGVSTAVATRASCTVEIVRPS